ncbi:MAG TPA: anhydro-N-acetylmuramic acid kinase [Rhizomicrobium sp.]|jgi:anhydro-N-acetylmuramic acid kinase|nr:anhydro-N-acetylmuramic acid kinase [Rhizomicrobium sp.]
MNKIQKVIGLMSGTSLDGVDAALLDTDGEDFVRPGPGLTLPYDAETRALLRAALDTAREVAEGAPVPHSIREAERLLTEAHAGAVKALLDKAGLAADQIGLIGFHGQTILHRPERRWTWQIGDGALLARLTGIDVVNDFRSADVKAGGQGAPLVPLYHAALLRSFSPFGAKHLEGGGGSPVAVVNIGGVANVTYIKDDLVLAFDTGPGNAPIDDWMHRHTGTPVDQDGAFARGGRIDDTALSKMLANVFFDRAPPKSLDRMDFGVEAVKDLSAADGAATLTAFTAATIAGAREHFPEPAATWIVCGGGRHNSCLMDQLRTRVNGPVLKAEDVGWNGDALEGEAFGYLAVRSRKGLPLSLPTTTGVQQPMTGGKFHRKP